MGKTKIIRKLKRREYKWKTDQYEVDNPANGSEDMFDVIPGNEKKKLNVHLEEHIEEFETDCSVPVLP